jgi:threonine/homoserine efflux transporter RhtA
MVYIDVRDRKFQLIVLAPIILMAILFVLVVSDTPENVDIMGVLLAIVAVVAFLVYLLVNFVLERVQS